MITFRHVQVYFRVFKKKQIIFNRLNFSIQKDGITLIRGDSGVGKSSLLKLISGQLKPNRGLIHLNHLHKEDIRSLPHEFSFFPTWTIDDYRQIFSIDETTFNSLNLHYLHGKTMLSSLSGGEKLRLLLLILSVQRPKLLLLDEPTHALDDENVRLFINLMRTYPNKVIIATHDRRLDVLASQWIDLKDAYTYEITSMGQESKLSQDPSKPYRLNKSKVKRNVIDYVFHQHRLGFIFQFFEFQLLFVIVCLSIGNVSLKNYQHDLRQDPHAFRVSYISKTIKESIPNSPFNLIRYIKPSDDEIRQLLTNFNSIVIDDDYSMMLPKTMIYQDKTYQVRLTEFDYIGDRLEVIVLDHHHRFDMANVSFSFSIEDTERAQPVQVSFERELGIKDVRIIKTPLEEPTLYFSYKQIRKVAEETSLDHSMFPTMAEYIRHRESDYKLLIFKDGHQFFTIQEALKNQETFTLISEGFQTFNNQVQWMFLLDVGSLFLLAISVGILMMFQLLVHNHSNERLLVLFKMLVPLGVPDRWMKRIFKTHVLSSKVMTSSVLMMSNLGVYQVYAHRFMELPFHLFIGVFIVMVFIVITGMILRYQEGKLTL